MSRGRRAAIGVSVVLVAIVAVAAWALWPRSANEVTEDQALEDFRERSGGTDAREEPAATLPAAGVYTYAAEGEETVRLGVLPSQLRPLSERVTAVVVREDECFELTLNLFAEHVEDTRFCRDGDTLRIAVHRKHQRLGAISAEAEVACDPELVIGDADEGDAACSLEMSAGPATMRATVSGTLQVGGAEDVAVGSGTVSALPVEVDRTVSGDLSGRMVERWWFDAATWLPVRIEREIRLEGPATFDESSTLVLSSAEPTT